MSDPFSLLGLPRRPWLEEDAIRHAFQERARQSHPDAEGGDSDAFAELNAAKSAVASTATRLRLLIEDTPLSGMPADIQFGFRFAEVMRKVAALAGKEKASDNVLVRALLAKEVHSVRKELEEMSAELQSMSVALDTQLRLLDERWPGVRTEELAELAGEYVFLARWQEQTREARLALRLAFG